MPEMSKIILDIQIAEVYSQGLDDSVKNKFEKNYDSLNAFYASILKHHAVTYGDYNEAMEWYKNHPVLMDSMLGMVSKELTAVKKRENIEASTTPPGQPNAYTGNPKKDSIKKEDSLRLKPLKDTADSKNKLKPGPTAKSLDSVSKKRPFLKREP